MEDNEEEKKYYKINFNIDKRILDSASDEEKKKIEELKHKPVKEEPKEEVKEEKVEEVKDPFKLVDVSISDKTILCHTINHIIDEISNKIVGQEEAIKTLVTNIFYNQLLIEDYYIDPSELDSRKVTILIDGPTGTGKSAILKEIAAMINLPIAFCNATSFSETGYVGPSITDTLRKLYKFASNRLTDAEKGIIVFDEVDKLASTVSSEKDMKKGVQEELLGFISGGIYDFPLQENNYASEVIHFDTSKLTFILSGAFTHLRERKIRALTPVKKNPLGFIDKVEEEEPKREYTITPQDYVEEGLHREFFGRIKVLTCTKGYNYDDLFHILCDSSISPLKNFTKTAKMFGYNQVEYEMEFIDKLINKALDMGTGARALQTIMSGVQNTVLLKLINQEYDRDEPLIMTPKMIDDYFKTLVRKI